ncbi:MAG: ATP-binding cassette domain-containing protein [Edaphocola sp.]
MQLQLENIIPEPLKDRVGQQPSDVWQARQELNSGELVFFRAPSGKGKSTFIHILYGLRKDYAGAAKWDNKLAAAFDDNDWARMRSQKLSIVFQDLRLFGELTVEENLALKQSLTNDVPLDTARQWLEALGLKDKWHQRADTLSYGERQRVAIVRSLLQPFDWLLLDEPFSHLDDDNSKKAATLIMQRVGALKAGLVVVDLENNDWFPYTRKLLL